MKEIGKIVEINGSIARIEIEPSQACEKCPSCDICHPAGKVRELDAENHVQAKVGDLVELEILAKRGVLAAFLLFGMPIVFGLIGIFIGQLYGQVYAAILGFAGLLCGFLVNRLLERFIKKRYSILPRIVHVLESKKS